MESIRQVMSSASHGIVIRMVDGRAYDIPHPDAESLDPARDARAISPRPPATSFVIYTHPAQERRLFKAPMVAQIKKRPAQGQAGRGSRRKSA